MTEPSRSIIPEKEKRLNAMIAEYLKRKDAGQNVNKVAMLKAYPDLADGLRSYFQGEAMMGDGALAIASTKLSPIPLASDVRETLKPGAAQAETASEFGNRKFGRYQILRPLGEGAMGSVYLALDTTLDRQVALKVPKTEGTANAEFMARFTREAKAAAALKHANICSVYDAGEHEGTAYITMDFIDGVPLSRFIGSRKLQSVDSILQMITIIAEAVGHAHSKGVIHRDLKPGNILVDSELKPHVTDFGLARRVGGPADESRITQEGLLIGTPAYMAPEQVKGEQAKVGPQSDIYSLGVILFELLTSRLPFEGKVAEMLAKVLRDNPPVPSHIRKDLSEDVDDICLKMLKKEPGQRYSSMAEVIAAIAKLPKKSTPSAAVPSADAARAQAPYEVQKAHVELMLKKGQYAAAIQDLEKLTAEKSPGAKAVGEWARAKLPIARAESKALSPSGLAALLQTGQQLFAKSDYLGCIQLLDDVPSLRRTEAMEELLLKARKREADAEQLLSDIKDRERRQEIDGLEPLVKRFLKLKPGNTYAKRLWEALQTYSKTPATRRTYRYEKGRLQAMPETNFLKQWTVLGWLVGVLVFLSVYAYVVINLQSGNQTLAVHVDDEWLKSQGGELTLVVDGNSHKISAATPNGDAFSVIVTFGAHTFAVKHGDSVVNDPKTFNIEKDGRRILHITKGDILLAGSPPPPRSAIENTTDRRQSASNTPESPQSLSPRNDAAPQLAIAPFSAEQAKQHQQAWATAINQPVEIQNSIGMTFKMVPPGEFMMGSPDNEPGRDEGEKQHRVRISKPFYMAAHEVTRAQFEAFVQEKGYRTEAEADGKGGGGWDDQGVLAYKAEYIWRTPGFPQEETHPVVHVSWNDAQEFTKWLSVKERVEYRLPTEAEWEYACRAGSTTMHCNGNDPKKLVSVGNLADAKTLKKFPDWTGAVDSSDNYPYSAPVGSFQANAFDLYDLHGNVWEWCDDRYDSEAYDGRLGTTVDPCVTIGTNGVKRGGGWTAYPHKIRSAYREQNPPDDRFSSLGFRVARSIRTQDEINVADGISLPRTSSSPPPLAIAPFDADQANKHQAAWAAHLGKPVEYASSIGMKLRLIPPGEFMMGSPDSEKDRQECEGPVHRVRLTRPFYMGTTEVTQSQWFAVMGTRPWQGDRFVTEGDKFPVSDVDWNEGSEFCQKLSAHEGSVYRFPTEAEWEYACRAGASTMYSNGDDAEQLASIGNVADAVAVAKFPDWNWAIAANDGYATTSPVGQFRQNNFGLLDMHGNVSEFCFGMFDSAAYSANQGVAIDPNSMSGSDFRVLRGGSAYDSPGWSRTAARNAKPPLFRGWTHGFRVVREITEADKERIPLPVARSQEPEVPDPNAALKNISQVHGATAEALVAWAKSLPAGYRPYWLSVQGNTKPILYDALASRTEDQSEWIMQFYDHADETNWAEMKKQYRHALLNVYAKDDIYERLVLWIKGNQEYGYWLGSEGFMEEKLNEGLKWDQGAKSNRERWLPTSVVGHWFEGGPTYDMLMAWLPYHQCEWALNVPLDELPALVEKYREKGWQPANLNIINGSVPARCSAVFGDNPENRKWTFSPRLSVNEYRSMLIRVDAIGGQPQCVFSRVENNETIYSVLWHGVEL